MQESIIILCLTLAVAYLGYTVYKKIRNKNVGCCGCSGGCCSKQHGSNQNCNTTDIQAFSSSDGSMSCKPPVTGAEQGKDI